MLGAANVASSLKQRRGGLQRSGRLSSFWLRTTGPTVATMSPWARALKRPNSPAVREQGPQIQRCEKQLLLCSCFQSPCVRFVLFLSSCISLWLFRFILWKHMLPQNMMQSITFCVMQSNALIALHLLVVVLSLFVVVLSHFLLTWYICEVILSL